VLTDPSLKSPLVIAAKLEIRWGELYGHQIINNSQTFL
jgi:hypothetical protein